MPSSSPPWITFSTSFVSDFNLSSTSTTFSFLDLSPISLSPLESFALSSSFMFSYFFAGFSICKIFPTHPHHFHHLKYLQHELPTEKFFQLVNLNLLANLHMMYCPIQLQHPPSGISCCCLLSTLSECSFFLCIPYLVIPLDLNGLPHLAVGCLFHTGNNISCSNGTHSAPLAAWFSCEICSGMTTGFISSLTSINLGGSSSGVLVL